MEIGVRELELKQALKIFGKLVILSILLILTIPTAIIDCLLVMIKRRPVSAYNKNISRGEQLIMEINSGDNSTAKLKRCFDFYIKGSLEIFAIQSVLGVAIAAIILL